MNLHDEVEKIKGEGYSEANAEAKLCQDIVLKAIAESGMGRNATIKGGVVMRSISKNARRATQDLTLEQEEYAFDVGFQDDAVSLLINSRHQMITEKLKSLVRFGSRSTRYKDVFDIYYLKEEVDVDKLRGCIEKYIFADNTLRNVTSMDEVVKRVERVFTNKKYISDLEKSGKNWLGVSTNTVLKEDVDFLKSI